jgi:hypothetical protein
VQPLKFTLSGKLATTRNDVASQDTGGCVGKDGFCPPAPGSSCRQASAWPRDPCARPCCRSRTPDAWSIPSLFMGAGRWGVLPPSCRRQGRPDCEGRRGLLFPLATSLRGRSIRAHDSADHALLRNEECLATTSASCGPEGPRQRKVDPVFRSTRCAFSKVEHRIDPKSGVHFWVRCSRVTRPACASDSMRSLNLPCRCSAWSRVRAEPSGRRPCVGAGCGLHPRTHAAPYR